MKKDPICNMDVKENMDDKLKTKFITITVKIMAGIVAFMILPGFGYVFSDFIGI